MKKILLSIFFIFILSVSIRAEYSDTITETSYSLTDTITIEKVINITIHDTEIINNNYYNFVITFDNYTIGDSYSVYRNGNIAVETTSIISDTIEYTFFIGNLKKQQTTILVFTEFGTDSKTFTINTDINIIADNYSVDTTINITTQFTNYAIDYDSYSIIVNGDTQIDRVLIDTDIISAEITLLENTINQITILTDFESETINIIHATQTSYSLTDTIIINATTFTFELADYISDYSRFKKLAELYSDLQTTISNYSKWKIIAIVENDNYYREPNLPYLKFKRLADKYK